MEAYDVYNNYEEFLVGGSPGSDTIAGYFDFDNFFPDYPPTTIPSETSFYDFDIDLFQDLETFHTSNPEFPLSYQEPVFPSEPPSPISNKRKIIPVPITVPLEGNTVSSFTDDTQSVDQHEPICKKLKAASEPFDELDTLCHSESGSSMSRGSRCSGSPELPESEHQRRQEHPELDDSLLEVSRSSEEADSANMKEGRGMLLIHLLVALAEAISNDSRDLAEVILLRLRKLVNSTGTNIERIGFYFYHAFQWLFTGKNELDLKPHLKVPPENFLQAYRVLIEIYPCSRLAQFTANQCILESIPKDAKKLHILDFDLMDGLQWPPLMQALVSEGYAIEHIKLTSIKWVDSPHNFSVRTLDRLQDYAKGLNFSFSSQEVELEDLVNCLREEVEEEVAVANCMFKLFHMFERSSWQVSEFLDSAKIFYPRVFTLGCCNSSEEETGDLMTRLASCLQIASAVCDSLESALPTQDLARQMVERLVLGPRFCRDLMFEKKENNVRRVPEKLGLVPGRLSVQNLEQARDLLRLQAREGHFYQLDTANRNEISLKWGETCLLSTSSWHVW